MNIFKQVRELTWTDDEVKMLDKKYKNMKPIDVLYKSQFIEDYSTWSIVMVKNYSLFVEYIRATPNLEWRFR